MRQAHIAAHRAIWRGLTLVLGAILLAAWLHRGPAPTGALAERLDDRPATANGEVRP